MSTINAKFHVIDENGNRYDMHQTTSISDVDGLESALNAKANASDVTSGLAGKVDKETGKGLSTNDYTTAEKNKLSGIEAQANKTIVDAALSSSSTNPVQNKVITTAFEQLKNYVTPEMFGAKGDGITDDTAAIQSALDNQGYILFAPNKTYLISETLVVNSYTTVDFNNSTIKAKADSEFISIAGLESMIRNYRMGMMDEEKDQNIVLKNLILDNNGIAKTAESGCIHFRAENSTIENVRIRVNGNNMWGINLFAANSDILINKVFINNDSAEGSLGGCLWVRTGINNGRPTKNVVVSNSRFESSAKDEVVALMSYRVNCSVTIKMINCYVLGKAVNILPDFLLTFRSQNSGAFIEGELIANTIEGKCNESLLAVSGSMTKGFLIMELLLRQQADRQSFSQMNLKFVILFLSLMEFMCLWLAVKYLTLLLKEL